MPYGPRVGAHALLLGEHRRVVLGLLEDPQGDAAGARRRRSAPAGRASRSSRSPRTLPGSPQSLSRARDPSGPAARPPRATRSSSRSRSVLGQSGRARCGRSRSPRRCGWRPAGGPWRRRSGRARAARRSRAPTATRPAPGSLAAADDLEVVEPDEQGGEQREHERLDHDQAQPAALGPTLGGARTGVRIRPRPGPARAAAPAPASAGAARAGVSGDVPDDADQRPPGAARGTPTPRSPSSSAAEREDRRADERATPRPCHSSDRRSGGASWRTRPATYPTTTRASAQRPATWSAGGARSSGQAGDEAEHQRRTAGPASARRRPRRAGTGWGRRPARRGAGTPTTCSTSATSRRARAPTAPSGTVSGAGHRRLPSASITARSLVVPDGHHDADQVEGAEVDERLDHRALARCRAGWCRPRSPGRPAPRRRTAHRPRCPR